jgi:D-sedoheptulose 7-phosphate isomerase
MSFSQDFCEHAADLARKLPADRIEAMAAALAAVRERGGRLFFLGVGGGAGHASHAVNDFRKIAGFECYTPTDNVSELTARINDDGWETSYAKWLEGSRIGKDDAVFVFSVGGGNAEKGVSLNLVRALELAKRIGAEVFGVVGRDGGYTAQVADVAIVIPTINPELVTPLTEAFQAVVWHLLVAHPKLKAGAMKWESLGR